MTFGVHHDVSDGYAGYFADAFQVTQIEREAVVCPRVPVDLAEAARLGEFLDGHAALLLEPDAFVHDLLGEMRDLLCFSSHGSNYS